MDSISSYPANLSAKTKKAYERFTTELAKKSVETEWRVLAKDDARKFHVRLIADDDETFELPPLNSVLSGTADSIRESSMPLEVFETAWEEQATPPTEMNLS